MPMFIFAIELYLACVLSVAGLAKIEHRAYFAAQLRSQRLLPDWLAAAIAALFPWCEVLLALALVAGVFPRVAALLTGGVFLLFLAIKCLLFTFGKVSECSCFGPVYPQPVDLSHLVAALILVALAALPIWATQATLLIAWPWRASGLLLMVGMIGWVLRCIWLRRSAMERAGAQSIVVVR